MSNLHRSNSLRVVRMHKDEQSKHRAAPSAAGVSFIQQPAALATNGTAPVDDLHVLNVNHMEAHLTYATYGDGLVDIEDMAEARLEFVALLRAEFWAAMQNGHLTQLSLSALLLACDRAEVRA